jgi:AAA+ ATPase superfamily predicted ATPase
MENLQQKMDADPSAGTKVDSFGMTPFHILALSQTPNLSLLQALLAVYQVGIICTRDKFGSTPIDCLSILERHRRGYHSDSIIASDNSCQSFPLALSGSMAVRGHLDCNE